MYTFQIQGLTVETKVPTLAQLTALKQAPRGLLDYAASKSLIKGTLVSPSIRQVLEQKSSCVLGLATCIAQAAGVGGMVQLLEDFEIPTEEMSDAFVKRSDEFAGLYKDPEDERRILMPILVSTENGDERAFIIRRPIEVEVERYRKANTIEAAKLLATKIVLWGDVEELERTLPGMYLTIVEFALDACGDWEARRVGEA